METGSDVAVFGRRAGGLKIVRPGVWRVDAELPRAAGEPRRRVSRTVEGSEADAQRVLDSLLSSVLSDADAAVGLAGRRGKTGPGKAVPKSSRSRGSGSIHSLGPDRWLIGVEGPADPVSGDRRRYTRTVRGDRSTAEVALAQLRLALERGETVVATNARSLESACRLYLAEARTGRSTVRTDQSACRRICDTVLSGGQRAGDLALAKLDWKRIEEIFAKWDGHLGAQARARYASTLSKVIDHAMRSGWVSANVVKQAKRPRVPTHKPDVPVTADVRAALDHVKALDLNFYAYVLGLSTLGCRRSELLAVHVGDVDLANRVITIRAALADHGTGVGIVRKTTKRDDWRDVPITGQLAEVLAEVLAIRRQHLAAIRVSSIPSDSYLFSDEPDGSRCMRPDSTSQRWLRLRGGSDVTLAMLRRFVSTQLLDVTNGDYRTVASITGNSEETLRRWYDAGPNIEKKRAVMNLGRL